MATTLAIRSTTPKIAGSAVGEPGIRTFSMTIANVFLMGRIHRTRRLLGRDHRCIVLRNSVSYQRRPLAEYLQIYSPPPSEKREQ